MPQGLKKLELNTKIPFDSFDKILTFDSGNATVWALNCPAHYRALGVAVTNEPAIVPDGDVYCIKAIFTDRAEWQEEILYSPTDDDPVRSGSRNRNLNRTNFYQLIFNELNLNMNPYSKSLVKPNQNFNPNS